MEEWSKRFVLGITGSMGSGKSTATKIFESFGAFRISSDELARQMTSIESPVKRELVDLLGISILDKNGDLDRKSIAAIVFSNKQSISKLNNFLHPLIRQKTIGLIESVDDGRIIAWEAPLLFEASGESICDATLTVFSDYEQSWKRVSKRDSITEEEFQKRLSNQWDINEKIKVSDYKIANNKDFQYLESECQIIYNTIMNKKKYPNKG